LGLSYLDQRRWRRFRIDAPGRIIVMRGLHIKTTVECTVIDVAEGGALIEPKSNVFESEFYLELDKEPGKLRSCTVVRRDGRKIGVKFGSYGDDISIK
jgi:PilZ domain